MKGRLALFARGFTVTTAARHLAVNRSHLGAVLNGSTRGSEVLWSRVARLVGVPTRDLHQGGWAK
jgi:hypothetical protein